MWRSSGPRRREVAPDQTNGTRLPNSIPGVKSSFTHIFRPLENDAPFFWLLFALLATFLIFFSLFRSHHLSLNREQAAEFERRYQVLSNSTVYIFEVNRPESILSSFPVKSWNEISKDIDFVAFVYDDIPLFLVDDWIVRAEKILKREKIVEAEKGIGIVLFSCGCVVPNRLFQLVEHRLGGMECLLLPGFVLDKEDVHWIDTNVGGKCKRREDILKSGVLQKYGHQLMSLRSKIVEWKRDINSTSTISADSANAKTENVVENMSGVKLLKDLELD